MKVGVKFCGGCNPKYARGEEFSKLKEKLKDVQWVTGNKEEFCDFWLLICGCQRGCIIEKDFVAKRKILKLESPMDFIKAQQMIQRAENITPEESMKIVHIGDQACLEKEITMQDIQDFARVTLDYNKIHTDLAFAKEQMFGRPIAHGMLSLSLLSSVMGMKLPGEGTILMGCSSKFMKPVFIGDRLKAVVTLKKCRDFGEQYIAELEGIVMNQDGEIVTQMTANQRMSKQLFQLKK